ncbi:GGDEF domain-containing protein [Vibrio sp. LaRot3]|uniref:GGDEF domain-containing protein n=1 Tax=Vibrio sp. LaRot3 TaxID=2998829 RepID=UPI0022CDC240|nr:GGDEF domain-containing protein [Vibrio sp. LaRot3]MDA0147893.1 GGDEF domain-containing protein [Vibrio sp. LaRot3]
MPSSSSKAYRIAMEADDVVSRVLFDSLADEFNLSIEYVYYPSFNDILTAVELGESDFAANVTYTSQRSHRFDFSSPTNIEYTYLYSFSNYTLDSIDTVGIPKGTIYGDLIREHYPSIKQVEYLGHEHARQLLNDGVVDGVVDAINQLKPMLMAGLDAQLLNHQISIKPVSLIAPKNKYAEQLKQFEAYIHSASVQKLLRETIRDYQFNIRQKALRQMVVDSGIDRSKLLRMKIENAAHFASYQDNGTVTGITPDVLYSACHILMLNCQLLSHADEPWDQMYSDFQSQKIEIISPLAKSESRKQLAYFSDPYVISHGVMIKREGYKENVYSNVSELIVERIGVQKDDFYHELLAQMLPQKKLYTYSNTQQQVAALMSREVDYIAISRASFHQVLRDSNTLLPLVEDELLGEIYSSELTIGFVKNDLGEALVPLFNRAIKIMDLEKIISRHDIQPDWKATLQTEQRFARKSIALFVLVLMATFIFVIYLHHQSNTDNLTKLRNRRSLQRRFRQGIAANQTLIYLDVNKFKPINDTFGHEVGDQVLKDIAKKIQLYWKGQSYRIGGDEFILVGTVSSVELSYALINLQKMQFTSLDNTIQLDVSLAFGVSKPRAETMSLEDVMHEADLSMYSNKRKIAENEVQLNRASSLKTQLAN